ncbi:hypothetical protein ACWDZ8_10240 [Streptomyces sp. NPDC003233]
MTASAGDPPETTTRTLARLALAQRWVIPVDRRSFAHPAQRADPGSGAFFTTLATGQEPAAQHLRLRPGLRRHRGPLPDIRPPGGLPGLPAHVSWPALNASPADAVLALTANFSAGGSHRPHRGGAAHALRFPRTNP